MANLSEAVEWDIQQLQDKARAVLAGQVNPEKRNKLTWIEARRQRCRQARYERYVAVVELGRQGYTQLAIAERMGLGADSGALAACTQLSGTSDSQRSAPGSSAVLAGSGTRHASLAATDALFIGPDCGFPH